MWELFIVGYFSFFSFLHLAFCKNAWKMKHQKLKVLSNQSFPLKATIWISTVLVQETSSTLRIQMKSDSITLYFLQDENVK